MKDQIARLRNMAQQAIDEYHRGITGGEPTYPQWTTDLQMLCLAFEEMSKAAAEPHPDTIRLNHIIANDHCVLDKNSTGTIESVEFIFENHHENPMLAVRKAIDADRVKALKEASCLRS